MARRLSALRPNQRILALTQSTAVQRQLALIWGVDPMITAGATSTEEMLKAGEETLLESGTVMKGEVIVVMAGRIFGLCLFSTGGRYTNGGESPPPTPRTCHCRISPSATFENFFRH